MSQKTNQSRDLINNPEIYQGVVKGIFAMVSVCTNTSDRYNAIFGTNDLNQGVMSAALKGASVGGCANGKQHSHNNIPTGKWFASAIKDMDPSEINKVFKAQIKGQFARLKELGKVPKDGLTVAIDLHLIPRYDKKHGEELTRSKSKNGTKYFERYMTIHCLDRKMRIVLAASHLKSFDSVPEHVNILLDDVAEMGIEIKLALVDREFFSVATIKNFQERDVKYLMPCRNTPNVVAALREFAQKKRESASMNVIENNLDSTSYKMIITERTSNKKTANKETDNPEDKYIGFATNDPTVETEKYTGRWGIETAYAKIGECRAKTRITNIESRIFCFYYSLLMFNEWTIVRAILSDDTERQNIMTMKTFGTQMEVFVLEFFKPPASPN